MARRASPLDRIDPRAARTAPAAPQHTVEGGRPTSQGSSHPAARWDVATLQRTAGNRAVAQLLGPAGTTVQRGWLSDLFSGKKAAVRVVTIGSEKVRVTSTAEEKEAKAICSRLKKEFGVTLSSKTSIDAIKQHYSKVSKKVLDSLETNVWEMKELRAVLAAVEHYGPIMGKARATSSLSERAQGITSLGRVKQQVDANYKDAPLIDGVMGEYMSKKNNVTLFDAVTDLADGRYLNAKTGTADNATTLEANAIHEMAHGLIQPVEQANWVGALDFWLDANTPSGEVGAEAPPTPYGATNAGEDICESAAIFFTNRAKLKADAPLREAFLAAMVAAWTPPKKAVVVKKAATAKGGGT